MRYIDILWICQLLLAIYVGFSWIIAPLISMLQTTNALIANKSMYRENFIQRISGGIVVLELDSKKFATKVFISEAKFAFAKLRHAFSIALILYHFYLKCHIWIETDALGYSISSSLGQLTFNDLG